MARPKRCRRICTEPDFDAFAPYGIPCAETVTLTVEEYETIRLIDLEHCTHQQCAQQMDISRTTVTELYESARYKIADSIIGGKTLVISGGNYRLCDGTAAFCCQRRCRDIAAAGSFENTCQALQTKGEHTMRIAVTYENGAVFQHFGHTQEFKIYDVENGKVLTSEVVGTNGQGHGALADFLSSAKVDALICGGIGGGAQQALKSAGIQLYGGVRGPADDAVEALLEGKIVVTSNPTCAGHGHDHGEGGHSCGSGHGHSHEDGHSCGSHGGAGHSCGSHSEGQEHACGGHGGSCGSH